MRTRLRSRYVRIAIMKRNSLWKTKVIHKLQVGKLSVGGKSLSLTRTIYYTKCSKISILIVSYIDFVGVY